MKKIVCITGTRPQLVKHAILLKRLQKAFVVKTVHTAQHYQFEMSDHLENELFENVSFHRLPFYTNHNPAKRMAVMLEGIASFLNTEKPDAALVYGDTDTTLAGALAANKSRIPLVHVEAGERSFNQSMPEESNRIVTDALAQILFCVSEIGMKNLARENNRNKIILSGDVMKDLLLETAGNLHEPLVNEPYIFCTIHRSYNQNNTEKLQALLRASANLDYKILFPVHPATLKTIQSFQISGEHNFENIELLPPVSYSQSICYQKFAACVITDSGGIQKEAYWLKKRCLTFRTETEWIDTLYGGWNRLIYENLSNLKDLLKAPLGAYNEGLYGDGSASNIISENLIHLLD